MECIAVGPKPAVLNRESHMTALLEYFAVKRETTRIIEVKKVKSSECTRTTAAISDSERTAWYDA